MKILVFGKDGQVGKAWQALAKNYAMHQWVFLGRQEVDLSNPQLVLPSLEQAQAQVVINAAAYTAVDKAQEEKHLAISERI